MIDRYVYIYVMRHGEKDGDGDNANLTEFGKKQAESSADHLCQSLLTQTNFVPTRFFHSGLPRTEETAKLVRKIFELEETTLEAHKGFGFDGVGLEEKAYLQAHKAIARKAAKEGRKPVVQDWLDELKSMHQIRKRLQQALKDIAIQIVDSNPEQMDHCFFAASHSPTGELAATKPRETELMGEAGISVYIIRVTADNEAIIMGPQIVQCPLVK